MVLGLARCSSDNSDSTEAKNVYAIGETAEVEGIKVTVNSTRYDEGLFGTADDGKVYFVMDISLENTTDEPFISYSMMCYEVKDGG